MGKIATLAERMLARAGSLVEVVVPDDPDRAEKLGAKIKQIVGPDAFSKIEKFAEAALDERDRRRMEKEQDPNRRAMMLSGGMDESRLQLNQARRELILKGRPSGRGL